MAGAAGVLASEIDAVAAAALRLNALANGVPAPAVLGDILDGDGAGADVVLAGDVWYDRPLAERLLGLLERARARGASVLIGDIGRAFLPRDRFRVLDTRDIQVVADLEETPASSGLWSGHRPGEVRVCHIRGGRHERR